MTNDQPLFWLVYVGERYDATSIPEVTAIASTDLDPEALTTNARLFLAVIGEFWDIHGHQVVFAAEVTRWLAMIGETWRDRYVDFDEALAELDIEPSLLIQVSPVALAVVADAAITTTILYTDGTSELLGRHVELVRQALLATLFRQRRTVMTVRCQW